MSIQEVYSILPGPHNVARFEEWESLEQRIGTALPADYKNFVDSYGSGYIGQFLIVFCPGLENKNIDLENKLEQIKDVLLQLKMAGEKIPYPIFPEEGGVFPFAQTDNGDFIYWETKGDPDDWPVVVNEARGARWESFGLSMTDFLARILSRRLKCKIFPDDFPPRRPKFELF
jgi:hypothetical protein